MNRAFTLTFMGLFFFFVFFAMGHACEHSIIHGSKAHVPGSQFMQQCAVVVHHAGCIFCDSTVPCIFVWEVQRHTVCAEIQHE